VGEDGEVEEEGKGVRREENGERSEDVEGNGEASPVVFKSPCGVLYQLETIQDLVSLTNSKFMKEENWGNRKRKLTKGPKRIHSSLSL
jgi:hypothetical protein